MKYLFVLCLSATVVFGCKKDNKKTSAPQHSHNVEYTISPIDSNIIDVRFNNSAGELVTQPGIGDFAGGSKSVIVVSKPYYAKAGLRFEDMPFSIDEYVVSIFVDGELKARDTIMNIGQSDIGEGYVEYTIE